MSLVPLLGLTDLNPALELDLMLAVSTTFFLAWPSCHFLNQAKSTMHAERTQNVSAVAKVTIRNRRHSEASGDEEIFLSSGRVTWNKIVISELEGIICRISILKSICKIKCILTLSSMFSSQPSVFPLSSTALLLLTLFPSISSEHWILQSSSSTQATTLAVMMMLASLGT